MNHFVVILPVAITGFQQKLCALFSDRGFAYWHWSPDVWLLATPDVLMDAVEVRTIVKEIITDENISYLVLRVDLPKQGANWATIGRLSAKHGWVEWLKKYWEFKAPTE
jgi:hypothetical protein